MTASWPSTLELVTSNASSPVRTRTPRKPTTSPPAPSRLGTAGSSACFGLRRAGLARQQFSLAFHAAAVTADIAIATNDAMAGNGERDRVVRAGVGHSAHRRRPADLFRDVGVGLRLAVGDRAQYLVDAPLERRHPDVQR